MATTWWTAHVADAALESVAAERFLYLIQEYEPFTFAMGSFAALADQSYRFPHFALFSSPLLRDFFRRRGLRAPRTSATFENAITAVEPPPAAVLAERRPRRLLFYARPESHAARNMFELGVLALGRALERGAFAGWELHGIGTVRGGRRLDLGGGTSLRLLPRAAQAEYGELLRSHDVGLALMYTPHPSLVPIEMAAAGMLAVTNSFENKTAEALAEISPNLIAAEPGIDADRHGAGRGGRGGADDGDRRVRGSHVHWSRDWDTSFGDELIDRLIAVLRHEGRCRRSEPRRGRPRRRAVSLRHARRAPARARAARAAPARRLPPSRGSARTSSPSGIRRRRASCTAPRPLPGGRGSTGWWGADVVWLPAPAPVAVGRRRAGRADAARPQLRRAARATSRATSGCGTGWRARARWRGVRRACWPTRPTRRSARGRGSGSTPRG